MCEGGNGYMELSVLSAQFCCEPKSALKKSALLIKKKRVKEDHEGLHGRKYHLI